MKNVQVIRTVSEDIVKLFLHLCVLLIDAPNDCLLEGARFRVHLVTVITFTSTENLLFPV